MTVYADYDYYLNQYKGVSIASENEFDRLIIRATSYINRITGGRVTSSLPPDAVKMAACAVSEAWQNNEQGGQMASQRVGSWSVTYSSGGKPKTDNDRLYDASMIYLADTGLLTRWV